jgi:hypothetical protein
MKKKTTLIYLFSFLVMGILVLMMFDSFDYTSNRGWNNGYNVFTNSDSSLLYQISTDFLKHPASIFDWDFGTCFYIFPNLFIMLITTTVFSNPSVALFATSIILFSLLIYLVNFFLQKVFDGISKFSLIISNLSILLFVIYTIVNGDFILITSHLFIPMHLGAFINTIAALILVFYYLKFKQYKFIIYLSILNIISIFSDLIYFVNFIFPIILALVSIMILKRNSNKKDYLTVLISIVLSGILGYLTYYIIVNQGILTVIPFRRMPDNIINSFDLLIKSIFEIISNSKIAFLIMCVSIITITLNVYIIIKLIYRMKINLSANENRLLFYLIFMIYFFIITISAPVLNGTFLGIDCIRYIISPIYLTIFNTGLIIEYLLSKSQKRIKYTAIISSSIIFAYTIFILLNYSKNNPFKSFDKIQNYYPPMVKATDELSKRYNFKHGLGNYWDARFITVFSKQNVIVNMVRSTFDPVRYANNSHYYYFDDYNKKDTVVYNFVVLRMLEDTSKIYQIFDKEDIIKITLEGNSFYLLPDFKLKDDFSTFKIIHKSKI